MPLALLVTKTSDPRVKAGSYVPGPFNGPLLFPDTKAVHAFLDNHYLTSDVVAIPVGKMPKVTS